MENETNVTPKKRFVVRVKPRDVSAPTNNDYRREGNYNTNGYKKPYDKKPYNRNGKKPFKKGRKAMFHSVFREAFKTPNDYVNPEKVLAGVQMILSSDLDAKQKLFQLNMLCNKHLMRYVGFLKIEIAKLDPNHPLAMKLKPQKEFANEEAEH